MNAPIVHYVPAFASASVSQRGFPHAPRFGKNRVPAIVPVSLRALSHKLRSGGLAAASLALVATTALAAPPPAADTNAARLGPFYILVVGALDATLELADLKMRKPIPSPSAPRAAAATSSKSRQSADRRSLARLVRAHARSEAGGTERECLAAAVYFEAQGEPVEGQLAVAEVVLNRAASREYPSTICAVVRQPAQFSFVRHGLFPRIDRHSYAWRTAVAVAHVAAERLTDELSSDILWYHADYVAPSWGRRLERVTQIGAHIFYRRA